MTPSWRPIPFPCASGATATFSISSASSPVGRRQNGFPDDPDVTLRDRRAVILEHGCRCKLHPDEVRGVRSPYDGVDLTEIVRWPVGDRSPSTSNSVL